MPVLLLALFATAVTISTTELVQAVEQIPPPSLIVFTTILQPTAKSALLGSIFPLRPLVTFMESTIVQFTLRLLNACFASLDITTTVQRINAFRRPLSPTALVIPTPPLASSVTPPAI